MVHGRQAAIQLSGLNWESVAACARWMEPYFQVCLSAPITFQQQIDTAVFNTNPDDSYHVQIRTTSIEMFVRMSISFAEEKNPLYIAAGIGFEIVM